MEVVRGTMADRPWGATLAALHRRRHTGTLTLMGENAGMFVLALRDGAVVAATSPVPADSADRIASAIEFSDPLELAIVTRRTARTFAVEAGTFVVTDDVPVETDCALDLREGIYQGALTRMSDRRIADELAAFGARFELRGVVDAEAFGFGDTDDLFTVLRVPQSIRELEPRFIHLGVRRLHAIAYSLLCYGVCGATEAPALIGEANPSLGRSNTMRVAVRAPTSPPPTTEERAPTRPTRPITLRATADERLASGTLPPRTVTPRATGTVPPRTLTPSIPRTATPIVGRSPSPQRPIDDAAVAAAAFQAGLASLRSENFDQAVVQLTRATMLAPAQLEYPATLAWAKFCAAADKPSVATETRLLLSSIASREPKVARFYLGRMERALGRDREALAHFRDVLSNQPTHADAAAEIRAIEERMPQKR